MLTFAAAEVGPEIGRERLVLSPDLVEAWLRLFPDDGETGDTMPTGMVAIVAMRAYTGIVAPRPPGNVHGEQRFEITRLPKVGETLVTAVSCVSKTLKGERRWIEFATDTLDLAGRPLFAGRQTILWAA